MMVGMDTVIKVLAMEYACMLSHVLWLYIISSAWIQVIHLPIFFRVASLVLEQLYNQLWNHSKTQWKDNCVQISWDKMYKSVYASLRYDGFPFDKNSLTDTDKMNKCLR